MRSIVMRSMGYAVYPKLKGKGAEIKYAVREIASAWDHFRHDDTYEYETVRQLLSRQCEAQDILMVMMRPPLPNNLVHCATQVQDVGSMDREINKHLVRSTNTYYMAHTTYYILQTTYYILHTAYRILHIASCFLLPTCYLLLATCHLSLTTHHLPLTTCHAPLTICHLRPPPFHFQHATSDFQPCIRVYTHPCIHVYMLYMCTRIYACMYTCSTHTYIHIFGYTCMHHP